MAKQNKKDKAPVTTEKKVEKKDTRFKSGADWKGNKNGRPVGSRNFATLYTEALIKLANLNKTTPEDLEVDLIAGGFSKARKGDYRFYKDFLDRKHGLPTQKTDITTKGESLNEAGKKTKEQMRAIARKLINEEHAG